MPASAFSLPPMRARRGQDRSRFTVRISVTPRKSTALLSVGVTQFMGRSVGGHPAAPGTGEGVQALEQAGAGGRAKSNSGARGGGSP